jgi:TetR/AcrR family transcriptional regulator
MTSLKPQGNRAREAEKTRSAILDAAVEVFAERGFAGARIAQIAANAGVPAGLLYHHFHSKRDLFEAALAHAFSPFAGEMQAQFEQPSPTWASFEDLVRRYFRLMVARPRLARLTAWWYASLGWVESPVPAHALWGAKEAAARFVRRLRDAGELRPGVDPGGVVVSALGLCQHWATSHGENLHMLAVSAHKDPHEARLEQVLDLLRNGLRP